MPPSPDTSVSRRRPIAIGLAAIALIAVVAVSAALRTTDDTPRAPAPVPVRTTVAESRDVDQSSGGIGTAQPLQSVALRAQIDGVLTQVLFKEGDNVRKGALLARIDDREINAQLAQARAERARNEAELRAATLDLARYEPLVNEQIVSRQTVERQQALVDQTAATLRAKDAAIDALEVQASHTRIVAPFSGRVGLRRIDPGNVVTTSDAQGLATITQLDPISVVFTMPQEQLARLRGALSSNAEVVAFEREAGASIATGRLVTLDNEIDATTGTIRLRAEFKNADGALWPGQFVSVKLRTGQVQNAIVVASRAVLRGRDGPFVFRVVDGKAEVVPVQVGFESPDVTVIAKGLAPGDVVVVDGQIRLKAGSLVRVLS